MYSPTNGEDTTPPGSALFAGGSWRGSQGKSQGRVSVYLDVTDWQADCSLNLPPTTRSPRTNEAPCLNKCHTTSDQFTRFKSPNGCVSGEAGNLPRLPAVELCGIPEAHSAARSAPAPARRCALLVYVVRRLCDSLLCGAQPRPVGSHAERVRWRPASGPGIGMAKASSRRCRRAGGVLVSYLFGRC
jgi:hypothetical protein